MSKRDNKKRSSKKAGEKPSNRLKAVRKTAAKKKAKTAPAQSKAAQSSGGKKTSRAGTAKSKATPAKAKRVSTARSKKARAVNTSSARPANKASARPSKKAAKPSKRVPGKVAQSAKSSEIVLPNGYVPSDNEPFMNDRQRMYFRQKLLTWKEDIIRQTRETLVGLHDDSAQHADIADRATSETDRALELRSRDRQRKLVSKIDAALARIEDGSYGYCEETGEPIGLRRLDARPIATLSLEAQERHERRERVYRED